jgi:hypothetical protein
LIQFTVFSSHKRISFYDFYIAPYTQAASKPKKPKKKAAPKKKKAAPKKKTTKKVS